MVLFALTTILSDGTWTHATEPVIKEFVPKGRGDEWTAEDRQKFKRMLYFKRVLIVQLMNRAAPESGITRTHEAADAGDEFELYLKSGSYSDTNNMWNDVRAIFAGTINNSTYSRIVMQETGYAPQPGRFDASMRVMAYRGGLAV